MDFARKQLQKYGWKDGDGLGKSSQGIAVAIKPRLKTGKEGMGFDLCQELTGTWWTKAYSDSLSRINIKETSDNGESLAVSIQDDSKKERDAKNPYSMDVEERPMEKMRKRMMKANFTSFSKGGTLSNGEMQEEERLSSESNSNSGTATPIINVLSDDDLLKACGGRTAHKAARFGLKLNGKLARIAAQEQQMLLMTPTDSPEEEGENCQLQQKKKKKSKRKPKDDQLDDGKDITRLEPIESINDDLVDETPSTEPIKKKKRRKLENVEEIQEELIEKPKKKKKSKDKRRRNEDSEES